MDDSPYCSKYGCTPENLEQVELERLSESEPKLQNMVRKMLTSQENWRQERGRKNDGRLKGSPGTRSGFGGRDSYTLLQFSHLASGPT